MHTLTIDKIDDVLENEIDVRAEALGLNQAETVRKILEDALLIKRENQATLFQIDSPVGEYDKLEERRKEFSKFF